ncbi:hypothetical protein [Candidatus Spongiihabitans sp.]|uniref:hypothetical protein n=1 Tax=Candidatus Spongiihabitans sp. TaxID=3101308 RepID=UPI003C7B08E7
MAGFYPEAGPADAKFARRIGMHKALDTCAKAWQTGLDLGETKSLVRFADGATVAAFYGVSGYA